MSQLDRLEKHLKEGGVTSTLHAMVHLRIANLHERVREGERERGWKISRIWVKNEQGKHLEYSFQKQLDLVPREG